MGHSANLFLRNHLQLVSWVHWKPNYWELWSFDRLHRFSEKNIGNSNSRVSFIRWWQRAAWRLSPWQRLHGQRRDASTSTSTSAPLLVKGHRCSEREGLEKGHCWRPEACHGGRSILAAVLRFICRSSSLEFFWTSPIQIRRKCFLSDQKWAMDVPASAPCRPSSTSSALPPGPGGWRTSWRRPRRIRWMRSSCFFLWVTSN